MTFTLVWCAAMTLVPGERELAGSIKMDDKEDDLMLLVTQ